MNTINKIADRVASRSNSNFSALKDDWVREAITIRLVENTFLDLFSKGKMNGTVHTCVGQEFSAVAVAGQLNSGDWVTSNHRCHGHFISKTKNWKGLIDELIGLDSGVCHGVGSSQHLFSSGFISNGPQGALIPVALGIAKQLKDENKGGIVASFIGEGTFGEGVVYESLNLAALWDLPFLLVCENNFYSQSTEQKNALSGSIEARATAFGMRVFVADTWDVENLFSTASQAIEYVRGGFPALLIVETYRLNAHSKGDDNRDSEEVRFFKRHDTLNQILEGEERWRKYALEIQGEINAHLERSEDEFLDIEKYFKDQLPRKTSARLLPVNWDATTANMRMIDALNVGYESTIKKGAIHIGEDILDPYGGAFKVTKGLSTKYPRQVIGTPISEAAITGFGVGLSMMGRPAFVEIMFGDFLTLCLDQVLNNASKFYHMYGLTCSVPLRIRTPMGGRRGYGPTHSQSLEKYFVGIDNFAVISLTSIMDPQHHIDALDELDCPVLIIENKVDYGRYLWTESQYYKALVEDKSFGAILISPKFRSPTLTVVSYGETARLLADNFEYLFEELDEVIELVCLVQLHPLDMTLIERSLKKTRKLLVVEPGSIDYGIGAEILAGIVEAGILCDFVLRVGSEAVPIPSPVKLELESVTSLERIIKIVKRKKGL